MNPDDREIAIFDVYDRVIKFMIDNRISCGETVYQCDWVIENAYEFIDELFEIVKKDLPRGDEK